MGNKEVRDILLGRIVRQDEQFWTVAPPDAKFHFYGVRDGAGDVRLFGVMHLERKYRAMGMEPTEALCAAETALNSLGCPMRLASMPDAKACLYAPHWIAPVLLTVEQDEKGLKMRAYTGRSLLISRIRCRIALWILERRLPVGTTGSETKAEKEERKKETVKREETQRLAPEKKAPKRTEQEKTRTTRSVGKRVATPKKKTAPRRLQK